MLAVVQGQRSVQGPDKPIATVTEKSELTHRKEIPSEAVSVEGLIRLDTTVTDQAGKAVAGLRREDFNLLDDGQPQKIIASARRRAASTIRSASSSCSTH
jgi:hypothetical protein